MSLELSSVLTLEDGADHQVLIDYDTLEIIGAAADDPNQMVISVAAAMPDGPSEVVLATIGAQDQLLMSSAVLAQLEALVAEAGEAKAAQEELGITDEMVASAVAEAEAEAAEAAPETQPAEPQPAQPSQAESQAAQASQAEPAQAAEQQPVQASQAEPAPAESQAAQATQAEPEPAQASAASRDYEAIDAYLFALTPAQVYVLEDQTPREYTSVRWSNPTSRVELSDADGWISVAALSIDNMECGQHQITVLAANGLYYVYLPRDTLEIADALIAEASASSASGTSEQYEAVETYLLSQTPVQVYSSDGSDSGPHHFSELLVRVAGPRVPDPAGWTFTADITVGEASCGEHEITVAEVNGAYYLYASSEVLQAMEAAAGEGSSLETEYESS